MIIQYPDFTTAEKVVHAFSTREGGRSRPPFSALNMAFHVGDDPELVRANRKLFFANLGLDLAKSTWASQVHGDRVAVVTEATAGAGALDPSTALPGTDAMVSNTPGVSLCVMTADCLPILIFDERLRAIGAVHAGWRGTLFKLPGKTLKVMSEVFGTDPADCRVALGPGIGPCCFQVGQEVLERFAQEMPAEYSRFVVKKQTREYIDLYRANSLNLQGIGVPAKNILVSSACTSCNSDRFFSYRAEQGKTGRMVAVIGLLE